MNDEKCISNVSLHENASEIEILPDKSELNGFGIQV